MMLRVLRLRHRSVRVTAPSSQWGARAQVEGAALSNVARLQNAALRVDAHALRNNHATLRHDVRFMSSAIATNGNTAVELRGMCNVIRNDLREAPPTQELVSTWHDQIERFQKQITALEEASKALLVDEIRLGYESAIAIASKQRQFDLTTALFEQMKAFGLVPTDATFQYAIRGVALELIARPSATSVEELREILTESRWERDLLEIIRSEEYAHYRKTPVERKHFHQQLFGGIEAYLNEYEAVVPLAERSSVPYSEALRVYASNEVPFSHMLQLMVKRSLKPDVEMYAALLQGARWSEIPATVNQLLQSGIVEKLTAAPANDVAALQQSHDVRLIWMNAMKAILNSYTSRFFDRKEHVSHKDVEELKKVYLYVEKQLNRAFPKYQFASSEHHEEVYTIRAKAAATAGLQTNLMKVLDEYVASAPVGSDLKKDAFLSAIELYTSSQLKILHLPRELVQERALRRDVSKSRRVSELERVYARFADKLLPSSIAKLKTVKETGSDREVEAQEKIVASNKRTVKALERRLNNARIVKSYQLLIQEEFEIADKAMQSIQDKLSAALNLAKDTNDLDVQLKLMEQYMTCANRYEQRLRSRQKEIAPQIVHRVFRIIKQITANETDFGGADREKLNEIFHLAIRTAILYWRYDDADKLVRKKKSAMRSSLLSEAEYELLIFKHVTNRDIRGAYALVQEMHNAGMAPPKEAIHRIVLGLMHQVHKSPEQLASGEEERGGAALTAASNVDLIDVSAEDRYAAGNDGEDNDQAQSEEDQVLKSSDTQTIEEELSFYDELQFDDDQGESSTTSALGFGAPASIVDIASFLQDWYNLHGIRPAAKTVVPVFARLLATKDFPEFKRLLQILESMEGGLTPATTVWLEKRLEQLGKTLDDFRLTRSGR
ncbi:hypothetical protein FI667_g9566, partial [Globisporangium splendens]